MRLRQQEGIRLILDHGTAIAHQAAMPEEIEYLQAVLVTASEAGEDFRRSLVQEGIELVTTTASLAQLRRALVRGDIRPLALCITLDQPTLRRHGRALSRLLDDRAAFAVEVRAIGLLSDLEPAAGWGVLGCDAHTNDAMDVVRMLRELATARRALSGKRVGSGATAEENRAVSERTVGR